MSKPKSWDATVELEKRIWAMLNPITEKYGVKVKMDAQFDKGKICIVLK